MVNIGSGTVIYCILRSLFVVLVFPGRCHCRSIIGGFIVEMNNNKYEGLKWSKRKSFTSYRQPNRRTAGRNLDNLDDSSIRNNSQKKLTTDEIEGRTKIRKTLRLNADVKQQLEWLSEQLGIFQSSLVAQLVSNRAEQYVLARK